MKQPDNETIAKWMDGMLEGSQLKQVESWADENPDDAAKLIASLETPLISMATVPQSVEPPYPDFFNSKLEQEIQQLEQQKSTPEKQRSGMRLIDKLKFIFAPAAGVAMVVCFYLGTQLSKPPVESSTATISDELQNSVYVPNESVTFEQHEYKEANVIVLDGLKPIADNDIAMLKKIKPEQSVRLISAEKRQQDWY